MVTGKLRVSVGVVDLMLVIRPSAAATSAR
jgi:hypothetical protein